MIDFVDGKAARRARRYPITAPLQFRAPDDAWYEGTTVNIGARGLLFRTHIVVPVSSLIELRIALSAEGPTTGPHIACAGRVVRSEPALAAGDTYLAVAIDQVQLRPAAHRRRPQDKG
jgi:hypothetical protein